MRTEICNVLVPGPTFSRAPQLTWPNSPPPPKLLLFNLLFLHHHLSKSSQILASMTKSTGKAIETANNIQLALEARKKDPILSLGEASVLFKVSKPSIYDGGCCTQVELMGAAAD